MATTSSPPSTKFTLSKDFLADFYYENPFPEGFTLEDLKDPKVQQKLFTSLPSDEFCALADSFKKATGKAFGVVWIECDCDTGDALTWEEAETIYSDLQLGIDEPGDDCGNQWYSVTDTGFPTFGWDDEHHFSISERYLQETPEPLRSKIIIEFLLPHCKVLI